MKTHESITPQHIMAIRQLNQRLGDFVCEALWDEYNHQHITVDRLLGHVAQRTLSDLDRAATFEASTPRKASKDPADSHNLASFAYERYAKFVANHSLRAVSSVPPADVGLLPKAKLDALLAGTGSETFSALELLEAKDDLVVQVWNRARMNRRGGLQRIGALYFLSSEIRDSLPRDSKLQLESELSDASRYLFNRASDFRETELKFAVILGGRALELTRADVVKDSFGPSMSVCQYFNRDERLPSYVNGDQSAALVAQIHTYAGMKQ